MVERRRGREPRGFGWVLGPVGVLVPARLRAEWRREWAAELWHERARLEAAGEPVAPALLRRLSGVLADAVALRWCHPGPAAEDLRSAATVVARSPGAVGTAVGFVAVAVAGASVVPLGVVSLVRRMPAPLRPELLTSIYAVAPLLLVAGVFAATNVVAQCRAGRREEAMRRAMGVDASRLGRQRRLEGLLVALLGSAAGVWLATAAAARLGLRLAAHGAAPAAATFAPEFVLLAGAAASLLTAVLMALAPAVVARRHRSY